MALIINNIYFVQDNNNKGFYFKFIYFKHLKYHGYATKFNNNNNVFVHYNKCNIQFYI
jgi:hypothetical protein